MRYLFAKYLLYGSLMWSCSCGANYHLRKAEQHIKKAEIKGAKVTADTVYKEIEVIRPEVRVDTLVKEVNFNDTIYVEIDRESKVLEILKNYELYKQERSRKQGFRPSTTTR